MTSQWLKMYKKNKNGAKISYRVKKKNLNPPKNDLELGGHFVAKCEIFTILSKIRKIQLFTKCHTHATFKATTRTLLTFDLGRRELFGIFK